MYDEDSSLVRWARWFARLSAITVVVTVIAGWYYLNRPQRGPWSRPAEQNMAILRDRSLRETERRVAGDALEHAGAAIVPDLILELRQGDALGRELAATALARLGSKASPAAEPLIAALNDPEPAVRERAAVAVGRVCSHPQTVVAAMRKVAHDGDRNVRDKAFDSLVRQEAAGAQALVALAGDADADVRRRAVIEVGRMAIEAGGARTALRAALDDADPLVRAEALAALAKRRALSPEDFGEAIDDRDALVRSTAFDLLGRLGSRAEPLVPLLVTRLRAAMDVGDLDTADATARILGAIGPAARPATDVLLEHVDAPHPVEVGVRVALQRIGLEAEYDLPELLERAEAAGDEVKSLILWDLPWRKKSPIDPRLSAPREYEIKDEDLAHLSGLKNLENLNLNKNPIGDAGLAHLAGLARLKTLHLWKTNVTSAGLAHLSDMSQLRSLFLAGCAITDDGLRQLRNFRQLEFLSLYGTQVTDAGMRELTGLTRLKKLEIGATKVTDDGLEYLVDLPVLETLEFSPRQFTLSQLSRFAHLKELDLRDQPIADDDLVLLAHLSELHHLRISRTVAAQSGLPRVHHVGPSADRAITDVGLAQLGNLKELQTLVLTDARITDSGLKHLTGLTKLRSLWLERCGITADGIAGLEQSLPGLRVHVPHRRQPFAAYKVVGLEEMRPFQ